MVVREGNCECGLESRIPHRIVIHGFLGTIPGSLGPVNQSISTVSTVFPAASRNYLLSDSMLEVDLADRSESGDEWRLQVAEM